MPISTVTNPDGTTTTTQTDAQGNVQWTSRSIAKTPEQDNADLLRSRATAALTANATFLAIASPTNAQVAAQVRTLTKENNALIRLLLNLLSDITDTA